MLDKIKNEIVKAFLFDGDFIYAEPFGCGHINATYAVYFRRETKPPVRYILQAVNTTIFTDPQGLMENIQGVTSHLRKKIQEQGGDPQRETLTLVPTRDSPWTVRYSSPTRQKHSDISRSCWLTIRLIRCMRPLRISTIP